MAVSISPPLPLPPGRRGFPVLGETGDWARDPLKFARDRHERYGLVWRTHLMGRPTAVLLGPEANRFILGSQMHLFSSREGWSKTITSLIGDGLSLLDGATFDSVVIDGGQDALVSLVAAGPARLAVALVAHGA